MALPQRPVTLQLLLPVCIVPAQARLAELADGGEIVFATARQQQAQWQAYPGFQAAAAFNADKSIAACVSWAPDIYTLSEIKGNHMLVSTATGEFAGRAD